VASNFQPLDKAAISTLLSKTARAAANGRYELFKTSTHFDSTIHHPEYIGGDTAQVKSLAS
jgi:uncharacterized protein